MCRGLLAYVETESDESATVATAVASSINSWKMSELVPDNSEVFMRNISID